MVATILHIKNYRHVLISIQRTRLLGVIDLVILADLVSHSISGPHSSSGRPTV